MSTVGSKNYNGQDWFWPHDYRHYLRDANPRQRKLVHNGWLKIGVPVKKSGLKISDRYLEPKKSQEKKAWTIVKKVIAPKELESVNEEAYYDSDNKIKTSIDNSFKKAGIKVVKFKPMKTSFHRGLWGGFYHIKSARGTDTIPVYVDKKGFIELGVSAEGFRIGKVGSSQVVKNLKDFKKSDIDESVNEGLNSKGFSIINQSIKTMAINFRDLQKLVKKQDDSRIWNEVDNIRYDLNRIEKVLKNKTYNESVNEGMTKYNIRLTKTPGWYGIWDKNGKQKAEGEKKYIIKFLKSLKTRMGNFQIKSLVDLAADRKGTNIAFDVAESVNEGFADKLTKKMKKHKGTSVKSKKKVKLKGRGVYQQYESDLPITTKKGKTVRAVHKKSGKEIVSVDNPSTRKILKKMGFVVKEFKYNLYQKLSDKQKVLVHLISKGNKASDAKKMVNKWYDKVSKMYKNANISKKAEIISTLSAKNEAIGSGATPAQIKKNIETALKGAGFKIKKFQKMSHGHGGIWGGFFTVADGMVLPFHVKKDGKVSYDAGPKDWIIGNIDYVSVLRDELKKVKRKSNYGQSSIVKVKKEGSCGYGIDGKVGKEPAGPHLIKKKKKKGR